MKQVESCWGIEVRLKARRPQKVGCHYAAQLARTSDIEKREVCRGHFKLVSCIEALEALPNTLATLAGQALEKILQPLALKESPPLFSQGG